MRVAVFKGAQKPITVEEIATPRPRGNDVLLKVHRCGICGSDITMTSGGPFDYPTGRHLGHEYSGEIVELGPDVTRCRVGDRVTCLPNGFCGECAACREGRPLFCGAGRPLMGGMGEYITAPETSLTLLPGDLSFADGALVEPMACGRRALRLAHFAEGGRLLVLGAGSIALSTIFWGRLFGAGEITVVSRSGHRRDVAMAIGADRYHSLEEDDPAFLEQLAELPHDFVAECIGKPDALTDAVGYVRPAGTVLSLGMCMQPEMLVPAACAFKDVTLKFPVGYSTEDFSATVDAFESDRVAPETMVSETIAIEDVPAAFERLRAGYKTLKVMVDPAMRHVQT